MSVGGGVELTLGTYREGWFDHVLWSVVIGNIFLYWIA